MQRRQPRQLGLDGDARVEHLRRVRELAEERHVGEVVHRPGADEGAAADMAPDQAVRLERRQPLAQLGARDVELAAQIPLRRQPVVVGKAPVRDVPPDPLRESRARLFHSQPLAQFGFATGPAPPRNFRNLSAVAGIARSVRRGRSEINSGIGFAPPPAFGAIRMQDGGSNRHEGTRQGRTPCAWQRSTSPDVRSPPSSVPTAAPSSSTPPTIRCWAAAWRR